MSDPLSALKGVENWVEWGVEDDRPKRPYSPTGRHPTGHDSEKSEHWGLYEDVESGQRGFVLTDSVFWGVDWDHIEITGEGRMVCTEDGDHDCDIKAAAQIAHELLGETYMEWSPSGEGAHAIAEMGEGEEAGWSYKGEHLEVYTTSRYLTVTEDETEGSAGEVRCVPFGRVRVTIEDHPDTVTSGDVTGGRSYGGDAPDGAVAEALEHVDPDCGYGEWLRVLFAVHSAKPGDEGLELAREWSSDGRKYDTAAEQVLEDVWRSRDPDGEVSVGTLFHYAQQNGWEPPRSLSSADWGSVLGAFRDEDASAITARDRAFDALQADAEFVAVRDTERLWRYESSSGVFRQDGEQFVGERLEDELGAFYSRSLKEELIDRLKSANWADRGELGGDLAEPLVACENCVVNLQTGETHDHSPDHRLIASVPVEYDPDAECDELEAFLKERVEEDDERVDSVFEAMACALAPGMPIDNFVILHGPPGTGKSTVIKVIEALVGHENASSEGLHRLAHDNHAMAGLYGKKANLAGDMDGGEIRRTRLLLQLSGGDTVTANPKHERPFQFEPTAEMVFSTNELPRFTSNLDPIARRLVPIEVPVAIPLEDHEPMHKVLARLASDEQLSGALNRAVEAYQRLLRQSEFSVNAGKSLERRREEYKLLEDPVEQFLQSMAESSPGYEVPKDRVFHAYLAWRERVGAKPLDKGQLTSRLTERDHVDTTRPTAEKIGLADSGGRVRCYSGIRLNPDGEEAADAYRSREDTQASAVADWA